MKNSTPEPDKSILEYDKFKLDDEWNEIARQIFHWGEILEDAERHQRDRENQLSLVEAEIKRKIRARPARYGIKRVTEPAIKEAMIVQPEYQQALTRVNRAKYKAGVYGKFLKALDAKKRGMEKTVDLYGQQYWSKPKSKHAKDYRVD